MAHRRGDADAEAAWTMSKILTDAPDAFPDAPPKEKSGRYGDFMRDVSTWVREGRIKYREDVVEGLENAPRALIGLLRGENFGKLLVRVAR